MFKDYRLIAPSSKLFTTGNKTAFAVGDILSFSVDEAITNANQATGVDMHTCWRKRGRLFLSAMSTVAGGTANFLIVATDSGYAVDGIKITANFFDADIIGVGAYGAYFTVDQNSDIKHNWREYLADFYNIYITMTAKSNTGDIYITFGWENLESIVPTKKVT